MCLYILELLACLLSVSVTFNEVLLRLDFVHWLEQLDAVLSAKFIDLKDLKFKMISCFLGESWA